LPPEPPEHVDEVEHRGLLSGADVERSGDLVRGRDQGRLDDLVHIYIVARLPPVAEDGRLSPVAELAAEDRDHPGLAQRVLAGAVDVAEPKAHGREPVQPAPEGA